ncbi:hypothetical protein HYX17_03730 [Candidatus Woesearchaeota archaeon]|nr:hypothetical protein [Candidatus Woesearchaeota archaeon]
MIDYSKPFRVKVIEDSRHNEELGVYGRQSGKFGICLGYYKYPNHWEKADENSGNPLILTDSGDYIWGCECWWDPNPNEKNVIPPDLEAMALEFHKAVLRDLFIPSQN